MSVPEDRCPTCGVPLSEPPRSDNCPIPEDHAPPHAIWEISEGEGFAYAEGKSAQPTPEDSEYRRNGEMVFGWFCIEGTNEEVFAELRTLGFSDEQIDAAR